MGIPEEDRKKGTEGIFEEIKAENFPILGKEETSLPRKHRESQTKTT